MPENTRSQFIRNQQLARDDWTLISNEANAAAGESTWPGTVSLDAGKMLLDDIGADLGDIAERYGQGSSLDAGRRGGRRSGPQIQALHTTARIRPHPLEPRGQHPCRVHQHQVRWHIRPQFSRPENLRQLAHRAMLQPGDIRP